MTVSIEEPPNVATQDTPNKQSPKPETPNTVPDEVPKNAEPQPPEELEALTELKPLAISSPALLLNSIAQRYSKTSRVIMEYIDNSIDAAEMLFNRKTGQYARPINIDVYVENKSIRVVDNCTGMDKQTLMRLISNVGDSNKRHSSFTNGQFGFGIHAFRACCRYIRFRTRSAEGSVQELEMDRKKEKFGLSEAPDTIATDTGTEVMLDKFDAAWVGGLDPVDIVNEISYHFDRLLVRKNLKVTVYHRKRKQTCRPFDYSKLRGSKIFKNYAFPGLGNVEIRLVVGAQVNKRSTHFVAKGRRINQIVDIKSFMRKSRGRYAVWAHPFLCGYIEVNGVLEPVITRDEFRRTATRATLFDKLARDIEPRLHKLLKKANEQRRVVALNRLENLISGCFNIVIRKDIQRERANMSYEEQKLREKRPREHIMDKEDLKAAKKPKLVDVPPEAEVKVKRGKRSAFGITFVDDLPDEQGQPMRAEIVGNTVQINVLHPDFKDRIRYSKDGRHPLITERLVAYLANVAASAFKSDLLMRSKGGLDKYREDNSKLFQEILDVTMSLEGHLRQKLGLMQRNMD